jgi:hypothetical protein
LTVELPELVTVPAGVVTLRCPVVAPLGTVTEIFVAEDTVNDAATPLSLTELAPVKFVPLTAMTVPAFPLVGDRPGMVAGTKNDVALVAVPLAVVTVIGPLVTELGTGVVIVVDEVTLNVAEVPFNFTAVAPVKFAPLIVTATVLAPLPGVKLDITGAVDAAYACTQELDALLDSCWR